MNDFSSRRQKVLERSTLSIKDEWSAQIVNCARLSDKSPQFLLLTMILKIKWRTKLEVYMHKDVNRLNIYNLFTRSWEEAWTLG